MDCNAQWLKTRAKTDASCMRTKPKTPAKSNIALMAYTCTALSVQNAVDIKTHDEVGKTANPGSGCQMRLQPNANPIKMLAKSVL